ncbi:hypothetical protein B0H14DRAFT_2591922 [Mycena olivaceomarginata]|nr:hypothetical protein B0H14DRAFT_2591922 [Mycena olivaceomarginata]
MDLLYVLQCGVFNQERISRPIPAFRFVAITEFPFFSKSLCTFHPRNAFNLFKPSYTHPSELIHELGAFAFLFLSSFSSISCGLSFNAGVINQDSDSGRVPEPHSISVSLCSQPYTAERPRVRPLTELTAGGIIYCTIEDYCNLSESTITGAERPVAGPRNNNGEVHIQRANAHRKSGGRSVTGFYVCVDWGEISGVGGSN